MRSSKFLSLCMLGLGLPLACGPDARPGLPELMLEGPWARATPLMGQGAGGGTRSAVYLRIRNLGSDPDRLLGGDAPVCDRVEIHESRLVGDIMQMRRLEVLDIPPGEQVDLKPGGFHLMLLDLKEPLTEGDTFTLFLEFEQAGRLTLPVPISTEGGK